MTVDPWSISSRSETPNEASSFRELNKCLATTPFVNLNPNYPYLISNLGGSYYKLLNQPKSTVFLHSDGWLDVSIAKNDTAYFAKVNSKIENFKSKYASIYNFSSLRYAYLKETIAYLNQFGSVYLVRLPVHKNMLAIENDLMPEFTTLMNQTNSITAGYYDMTILKEDFLFNDGNHLHKSSGELVSAKIALWIENLGLDSAVQ